MSSLSPLDIPDVWKPGLDALRALPEGGTALLIGATDRGKTTFTTLAARVLASEIEGRIALVDTDIGQSEIGPPGTVGAAWATPDTLKLHDLTPQVTFFVGGFAPNAVALELVTATSQAVRWARRQKAARLLVDTTGFVAGPAARRLKVAKAQITAPNLILGLGRDGELDTLLAALGAATGASVLPLGIPDAVGRKSQSLRATRRLTRLSRALEGSREISLPLEGAVTVGATLGSGTPLDPALVRWAGNALRLPAVYGELSEGVLSLFLNGPTPRTDWEAGAGPVAAHFGVRTVRAISLAHYADTLLGLHDAGGKLLSIGRFVRLDPERGEMVVAAPSPTSAERVRLLAFGRIRVGEDGSPAGDIKPGEL
jgi:polynucleotide 5'-hydroxyl-kinase GRC3/NOL9